MNEIERNSPRPFGKFTRKGHFRYFIDMVPFYNIPDLTDFKLKPYVAYSTPKVTDDIKVQRKISLSLQDIQEINE